MFDNLKTAREFVSGLSDKELESLFQALRERQCRDEFGYGTIEEAIEAHCLSPVCPSCGSARSAKDGHTSRGKQRYRCKVCGMRFCATSTTVLDYCKKDLPTWLTFIRLMVFGISQEVAADLCHISTKTAFEWRRRILASVDAFQEAVMLRGRIWCGEVFVPFPAFEEKTEVAFRGAPSNRLGVAFAFDDGEDAVAIVHGKESIGVQDMAALLRPHVFPGSVLVLEKRQPSFTLAWELRCPVDLYSPQDDNALSQESIFRLRSFLGRLRHAIRRSGSKATSTAGNVAKHPDKRWDALVGALQSQLNWFCFTLGQKDYTDSTEQVRRIAERLLTENAQYHRPASP